MENEKQIRLEEAGGEHRQVVKVGGTGRSWSSGISRRCHYCRILEKPSPSVAVGILRCQKAITKIKVVEMIALGRHRTHIHGKTHSIALSSHRGIWV